MRLTTRLKLAGIGMVTGTVFSVIFLLAWSVVLYGLYFITAKILGRNVLFIEAHFIRMGVYLLFTSFSIGIIIGVFKLLAGRKL